MYNYKIITNQKEIKWKNQDHSDSVIMQIQLGELGLSKLDYNMFFTFFGAFYS